MNWDEQVDFMHLPDLLAGLADGVAAISLAPLPASPVPFTWDCDPSEN